MRILFDELPHKYYLEGTNKFFTSVSALLDMVSNKFDAEKRAAAFVDSKNNSEGWSYEEILHNWSEHNRKIIERGNAFHLTKERESLAKGAIELKKIGGKKFLDLPTLTNLPDGEYVELMIPNIASWTIGTADKITIKDKGFFIRDYKCNEGTLEFEAKAYYNPTKNKKLKSFLQPPVQHIEDCKGMKYMLQLSLYSYFLEQFGYTWKGGVIEHAQFKNEKYTHSIEYPMVYLKKEAEMILKAFKLKNK